MTTYIITSEEWTRGCMGDPYCNDRVAALVQAGALHLDVQQTTGITPAEHDVVLTFVNPPNWNFFQRFPERDRWLFAVDESIGGDAPYARQARRCKEHGIGGVVTTYANPSHLRVLAEAGLKTCYFPLVMGPGRKRVEKTGDILASGQVDSKTYPERLRLVNLFSSRPGFHRLEPPGYWPNLRHQFVGERYLQLLDCYELVITDCAGWRDRFVAKYLEAAACHALPIGNVPSYMPDEAKELLIDTSKLSDDEVRAEVTCLLAAPHVLHRMQEDYERTMRKLFDPKQHATRVMWELNR